MNHYSLLKVSNIFTDDQLKKNYNSLVLRYHPDKNPTNKNKFEQIVIAYKTLSNPKKRSEYDKELKNKRIFLDTYFEILSMCVNGLKNKQKSVDLFLTIEQDLPFDSSKLHELMKTLIFQVSTCIHHNQILFTVQRLLVYPEIKNHEKGMIILIQILNYILSEIRK